MRSRLLLVVAGVAGSLAMPASAGVAGPQQQLSRPTTGDTLLPAAAATPDGSRALVVWTRELRPSGRSRESEVYARLVDRRGRPAGPQRRISRMGPGGRAGFGVQSPDVAYDHRRRRFLVVWSGNGSTEAVAPCRGSNASPTCRESDHEIYARLLDARGRPLGPQRRITRTGSPRSVATQAHAPSVAYQPRTAEFLVAYNAGARGVPDRAEIQVQRIDARGRELGTDDRRVTRLGRGVATGRIVADARSDGYLLAYTWMDPVPSGGEVYVRRLDRRGRPRGVTSRLTHPGGARESVEDVAADPRGGFAVATLALTSTSPFARTSIVILRGDGRPTGRAQGVPGADLNIGAGVRVAPGSRSGWLAAYVGDTGDDREIEAVALDGRGRARGRPFRVSHMGGKLRDGRPQEVATMPALEPLGRRGFLSAWAGVDRDDRGRQEIYARVVRR